MPREKSNQIKYLCDSPLEEISNLKPHPKNRNKHPKEQIQRLANIIKYQGVRHPIIVSQLSGFIVAGHGRLEAAKLLGMDAFPVEYQEFKSEEQEYAFLQSDNAIALWAELDLSGINTDIGDLGPDFDIDLLGLKDFKIEVADKYEDKDPDEVPEVKKDPGTVLGDIWKLGEHRLMCGNSGNIDEVHELLAGDDFEMIFTDPPYLQSTSGGGLADKRPQWAKMRSDGLSDFNPEDFLQTLSALNPKSAYIFCNKNLLRPYIEWIEDCKRNWNLLVMRKKNPIPLKNNTFLADVEWLVFTRGDGAKFNNDLEYDRYRRVFDTEVKSSEFGHPTEKRVNICERFIEISSDKDDSVLDLFGGSGSTLIACEKTNRKCFMMELEPQYVRVIIDRWEKFTGQKAELLTKI